MPPPNLGDHKSDDDDDNDDDDGSSDGSSSSDASTHSSDSNQGGRTDDEGEVDPIPMGFLDGKIAFEIPFCDKLRSFGLSELQANLIVQNNATSSNAFARLFSQSALDSLFKKNQLNNLRILVVQCVKIFHRWLNDQHGDGESLTSIALEGFTDQVMATLMDVDSHVSMKRECNSMSSKGTGLTLPTFNGNQSQFKVWSKKWRAYLGTMKNADGIPLLYVIVNAQKEK
jgi:hypothetical protein